MKTLIITLNLLLLSAAALPQELSYTVIYSRDTDKSYWHYIAFGNLYDYDKMINILCSELKTRGFTKIYFSEEYHRLSAERELVPNIEFSFSVYDSEHSPLLTQPPNTIGFAARINPVESFNFLEDIRTYARTRIPELQEELLSTIQPCKKNLNNFNQ